MDQAHEVAILSEKEFDSLRLYKRAMDNQNADLDKLVKEFSDLTSIRKIAYARFHQLAGSED
jgi:hypothetical protein